MKKLLVTAACILTFAAGADGQTDNKNDNTKQTNTMKTIALTKADFLTKVANYETNPTEWKYLGDKPALVDFYASWCGPCKALAPVLEELAAEYGESIYIYKINTEEEQELAAAFGIRSIPTLLFIPKDGKPQMAQGALPNAGASGAATAAGAADFFSDIAYTFFPVFHCKLETWMISGPEAVLPVSPTAFCSCQRFGALYLYNSYFFDVCKVFFGKIIPIFLRPER